MPSRKTSKAGKKAAKKAAGSAKRAASYKKGQSASVTKPPEGSKRKTGLKAKAVKSKGSKAPAKRGSGKRRSGERFLFTKSASAPQSMVAIAESVSREPSTDEECMVWKNKVVRLRVWTAVAEWAGIAVTRLTAATPLGALVPVWDVGEQTRLVANTNGQNVFAPFPSRMKAPPSFLPGTVTVGQWENIVWQSQTPRTPCFGV